MPAVSLHVTDFRCLHQLRVRWAEVDIQHIVFNAHYLTYFDVAMTDYWRALALPYAATMQQLGGDLYLKKASVEYHASAEMDDQLQVGIRCQRIGNSSLLFTGGIFRAEQLLVSGELVYVYADPATQTSRPVPEALRQTMLGFEAGEPVVSLRLGRWAEVGEAAAQVRTQVFVHEQAIPADMEWDEQDATALHAVLRNRLGQPVATGRLLQPEPGIAKVGRMAVLKPLRGFDLGRQVLQALMQAARERGDIQLILSAQRSAIGFYARQGYQPRGGFYDDVGIPHQDMVIGL